MPPVRGVPRLAPIVVLSLAACPAPRPTVADAGLAVVAPERGVDAGFTLTPQKLDAWLAYAGFVLAFPPLGKSDGGLRDEVQRRARLDEKFKADAGLSEQDVDAIEELVGAVVAQRNISRITGADAVKELERATLELKEEQRAQAQKALAEIKAKTAPGAALTDERARYGDENVRVLLTRETEVTKTWDALMDVRGDTR